MKNSSADLASLILQIYNLVLLLQDFNNKDLMQELQNQNTNYLEKIVKQNEQIITLLKEGK